MPYHWFLEIERMVEFIVRLIRTGHFWTPKIYCSQKHFKTVSMSFAVIV